MDEKSKERCLERDKYYEDLEAKFATATIRAADTYSGTSFNYIAYDLKKLLSEPPSRANSDMIRCIIDGIKEGLSELSTMDDRAAFHYIPLSAVEEAKRLAAGSDDGNNSKQV